VRLRTAFTSPDHKRAYVRTLFATIADRYDFITRFLSFGRDRAWKSRLVQAACLHRGDRVIDLACGTGDIAFEAAAHGASVIGLDITPRMIVLARERAARRHSETGTVPVTGDGDCPRDSAEVQFLVGDMMALPFGAATTDVVTTGYGLRNVPDLNAAIDEVVRILKPSGRLLSLDFNRPQSPIVRTAYLTYLTLVGSLLGWCLHGDPDTYRYIAESLRRYPGAEGVADLLRSRGFADVRIVPLMCGLMTLHVATTPSQESKPYVCVVRASV
jgi:demethylmenaquinone methyltransferase/2-methoxy-6-polyprenyl-1,4-benzoquinol methylase